MAIFASVFAYHVRHVIGAAWDEWLAAQLKQLPLAHVPGMRTIGLLGEVGEAMTVSVHASTLISRSRSMAAGEFLRCNDADVWVSCDEDVFADADTTRRLVLTARATRGFVSAPCWLRLQHEARVNFRYEGTAQVIESAFGTIATGPGLRSGFGLVAVHRSAVERIAEQAPWVEKEETGRYPALFLESVTDGMWLGEDFAFCVRAERLDVPMHLLCNVHTEHAGRLCRVAMHEGELAAQLLEQAR